MKLIIAIVGLAALSSSAALAGDTTRAVEKAKSLMTSSELEAFDCSEIPADGWHDAMERIRATDPALYQKAAEIDPNSAVLEKVSGDVNIVSSEELATDSSSSSSTPTVVYNPPALSGNPPGKGAGDIINDATQLINIGEKVFTFMTTHAGTVSSSSSPYATLIPAGVTDWRQLSNGRDPIAMLYRLRIKNWLGFTVVSADYTIIGTPGIRFEGKGQYLKGVTVKTNASVAWSFNLETTCSIPDEGISNHGSVQNPVASLMINIDWKSNGVLNGNTGGDAFIIRGDGALYKIKI